MDFKNGHSLSLSLFILIGAALEIVTDRSQEGSQFCRGFGGIGGKNHSLFLYIVFQILKTIVKVFYSSDNSFPRTLF